MSKQIFSLLVFLICFTVSAQQENISSYNVINIQVKLSDRFFVYSEGQLRGSKDFSYPDYYEIKGGVGYKISDHHKPLLGIGRYVNYRDHSLDKEEFRLWLQDTYDLQAGRFEFENRVRAEKSWFYIPSKNEHSDRVRFRYRLNISLPLNTNKVQPGTVSANIYDEVFLVATEKPLFARNRVFGGFSYQIDPIFSMSSGYLWQREFAQSGNKNLHFLYLALSIRLDASKPKNWSQTSPD